MTGNPPTTEPVWSQQGPNKLSICGNPGNLPGHLLPNGSRHFKPINLGGCSTDATIATSIACNINMNREELILHAFSSGMDVTYMWVIVGNLWNWSFWHILLIIDQLKRAHYNDSCECCKVTPTSTTICIVHRWFDMGSGHNMQMVDIPRFEA